MGESVSLATPELASRYDVASNALVSKAKLFETEIGDTKQTEFYPQVKVKRWANESNFSLRLIDSDPATPTLTYDKATIVWDKPSLAAHFYDTGLDEDGGFEFAVWLKTPPASNVVTFSIQTKGLAFAYQPPLTDEQLKQGYSRPDHVIGSYAVYHTSQQGDLSALGGQNYRAGKACHLYRPWAEDAKGVRVWCELAIDANAGLLTITVPQAFLDAAVYPVLIDPTLGYTSIGASVNSQGVSRGVCGHTATAPASAVVSSISVYGRSTSGACDYCMCLYDTNAVTGARKDYSAQGSRSGAAAWITDNVIVGFSVVNGTDYYVGHYHNAGAAAGNMETNYDTGVTDDAKIYDSAYSSPPPVAATVESGGSELYSAYLTYAAAGRVTKNTRAFPLGTEIGMNWGGQV